MRLTHLHTLVLCVLPLLAACGTPQERCINRNTRDLRTVERLIAETQGNLERGYAYEQYTVDIPVWTQCVAPTGDPAKPVVTHLCLEDRTETRTRPVSIDLNAERAKLESMYAKRDQLQAEAAPVIAQCKADNPK